MLRNQVKNLFRTFMFALAMLIIPLASAHAQGDDIEKFFTTSCKAELANYCSKVKVGQGRLVACLYAREDKLSRQCSIGVLAAMRVAVKFIEIMGDIADNCGEDLDKYCKHVEMGGGRLYNCLRKNKTKIRTGCAFSLSRIEIVK